jgi:GT2 family glycosyltransferase
MKGATESEPKPASRNYSLQLSIVIISYNTREITRACLESIRNASLQLKYEILVVDNASWDGSPDMIERDFPEVVLIRNSQNLMFAKANNQALRIAKGRYILLLNSDTLVASGHIEKLIIFLDHNRPRVGCVGPRVLNADGAVQSEGECFSSFRYVLCSFFFLHKLPLPFPIKSKILPRGFPHGLKGRTRRVDWVVGCCLMFPQELIEQFGGLDEDFVFYCEDTEFCYRLQKHGYETWVVPEAEITHLGGSSWLAAKSMGKTGCPDIPGYFERHFLLHQKTSGTGRQIAINRLQIFLYSFILPLFKAARSKRTAQIQDKIEFHIEENRCFLEKLARDGGKSSPAHSDAK